MTMVNSCLPKVHGYGLRPSSRTSKWRNELFFGRFCSKTSVMGNSLGQRLSSWKPCGIVQGSGGVHYGYHVARNTLPKDQRLEGNPSLATEPCESVSSTLLR